MELIGLLILLIAREAHFDASQPWHFIERGTLLENQLQGSAPVVGSCPTIKARLQRLRLAMWLVMSFYSAASCHTLFPISLTGSDTHPFRKEWYFIHPYQEKVVLCSTRYAVPHNTWSLKSDQAVAGISLFWSRQRRFWSPLRQARVPLHRSAASGTAHIWSAVP